MDGLDLSEELTPEERRLAEERRAAAREEEEREEEVLDGQVVSLPPQPDQRPPERKPDYLAQTNSRTDKETKKVGDPSEGSPGPTVTEQQASAEGPGPVDDLLAMIQPPEQPAEADSSDSAQREGATDEGDRSTDPEPAHRRLSLLDRDDAELRLAPEFRPLLLRRGDEGADSATGGERSYRALLPPVAGSGLGNGGTDEHLPNVEEGDETLLNARQFKYWSFFQRVKESLKRHWRPAPEYRRADPTGKVYGVRDRLTVLSVVLDRDGSLRDLTLVEQSGVAPLDDEAVRAFRAAQPFPNPPPGLVGEDGRIQFSFALFLDIQSGWEFRPLRVPGQR